MLNWIGKDSRDKERGNAPSNIHMKLLKNKWRDAALAPSVNLRLFYVRSCKLIQLSKTLWSLAKVRNQPHIFCEYKWFEEYYIQFVIILLVKKVRWNLLGRLYSKQLNQLKTWELKIPSRSYQGIWNHFGIW